MEYSYFEEFYSLATTFLYNTIDSVDTNKNLIFYPCSTFFQESNRLLDYSIDWKCVYDLLGFVVMHTVCTEKKIEDFYIFVVL